MPAIMGSIEIVTVTGEGILNFGDSAFVTPKEVSKTFGGSGGFSTGGLVVSNSLASGTNVADTELIDQPIAGDK